MSRKPASAKREARACERALAHGGAHRSRAEPSQAETDRSFGVFYLNQAMPFGGVKASGHGRFAGPEGLRALCSPKALIQDTVFALRTSIPPTLDYPIRDEARAWGFLRGLVGLGFGPSLAARARGVWDLVRNS